MAIAKKKTPTKRAAPRKAPAKRKSIKVTVPRYKYESFKLSRDVPPLMTFKITRQTLYWLVIVSFLIFFQLWIIKLQLQVAHVVNQQQEQIQQDL
ncbi:hypothetical protein GW746_01755 [Candidatus Saccharibacteria bacterium]|nr:hypothetical protein [Candidatus Saccharibacteria bacterium]NCS83119.1 hypothetical protein [Candidatus Saccharibacteria bacterium]